MRIIDAFTQQDGPVFVPSDAKAASTSQLVQAYADLKVWFAVNETTGRVPGGSRRHAMLGMVVDELRARLVLER